MIEKIKKISAQNRIFYNIIYILYSLIEKVMSIFCLIMRIIPIKKNKIVFVSAKGKRYGDNPMYISDVFLERKKEYDIVWLLKRGVDIEIPKGIRRVNYNIFSEMFELSTAKVWVDSNLKYSWILKRSKQLYIQTWHGSYGIKKIGFDLEEKFPEIDRRNNKKNAKIFDIMLSNSVKTTEIYRSAFKYSGKILEFGSPRNDIFFKNNQEIICKVRKYFKINEGEKLILYAPTYRANYEVDQYNIDYNKLFQSLEKTFGYKWKILVRLHPYNLGQAERLNIYTEDVLNASKYSVMQNLLVASDILITDYSSCMFDFVTTGKPCFLYATDVEEYRNDRDYYFDIRELPFPLAENNQQLEQNILSFNQEIYRKKLNRLFEEVGLCETGHASEAVVDYIEEWMREN